MFPASHRSTTPAARRRRRAGFLTAAWSGLALASAIGAGQAAAQTAHDAGSSAPVLPVPARTAMAVQTGSLELDTPNAHEQRPAESIAKIFVADAVLHERPSAGDLADLEAMITASDDDAADRIQERYPNAIGETIRRYGLRETVDSGYWGTMLTSAHDVSFLLAQIRAQEPDSPILGWMAHFSPLAADGTPQDWGTVHLPGVQGTKFGWSGYGPENVATASFGPGSTVAANTWGTPGQETADVTGIGSLAP